MILDFKPERRAGSVEPGDSVLEGLNAYWEYSRGGERLPLSENLFLSDLVDEMPHVLLAYRDNRLFQVEFAGDNAADLLGGSPIGATTAPHDGLPAAVSESIIASAERSAPARAAGAGLRVLCLPFAGAGGDVDLVLAGLANAKPGGGGTVVSFRR